MLWPKTKSSCFWEIVEVLTVLSRVHIQHLSARNVGLREERRSEVLNMQVWKERFHR